MAELRYAIVGRGRWGTRIASVLGSLGRKVTVLGRGDAAQALADRSAAFGAVWLAVPPAAQEGLLEAALAAGKHAVVEKPWLATPEVTLRLGDAARARGLTVGVHFEYCYLDALRDIPQAWRDAGPGTQFSGVFDVPGEDRLGLPAMRNLGCHLLAIKRRFVPRACLGEIGAAYGREARRLVRLRGAGRELAIDFTRNEEPLIQRFVASFEEHAANRAPFPLDLAFACAVNGELP
jgi:hypothetical protein